MKILHLNYTFPKAQTPFFRDLNFTLAPGINFLIGENGAGKTTLADILTGLRPAKQTGDPLPTAIYLNQSLPLLSSIRVCDVAQLVLGIETGRLHLTLTDVQHLADSATGDFLTPLWTQPYGQLSGGQRKLVQLLLFLQVDRPLVVLDEPTAAVDRQNVQRLFQGMRAHPQRTYVVITHDRRDLQAFKAYHVLWLHDHQVTTLTPTQLAQNQPQAAFLTDFWSH